MDFYDLEGVFCQTRHHFGEGAGGERRSKKAVLRCCDKFGGELFGIEL